MKELGAMTDEQLDENRPDIYAEADTEERAVLLCALKSLEAQ